MGSRVELFVHAVWATALRRPMIAASWKQELYRVIATKCIALDCTPRAIGGIADHVHLLAQIHATTSVAQLLAGVKGASSHAINQRLAPGAAFAWQACYFATSVSPDDVPAVEHYIRIKSDITAPPLCCMTSNRPRNPHESAPKGCRQF